MENLKDGLEFSSHREESSNLDKIGWLFGFLILIVFTSSLLNGYFNSLDQLYFHLDDLFLGGWIKVMLKISFVVSCLIISLKLVIEGGRKNPGVFYSKNTLIVIRNEEEGEIEIPLQMIKRILLHDKDSVIIKYHEEFLDNLKIPKNKRPSPLGEFIFKLNKKSIKIGPSLIDELNKKLK
jgi:hypothetical protein